MSYRMATARKSQFFLIISFALLIMTFYYFEFWEDNTYRPTTMVPHATLKTLIADIANKNKEVIVKTVGFLVYTMGCRIPDLNPFDKTILRYLEASPPIQCSEKLPLIRSNQTSIYVDEAALPGYNVSNVEELNCCFSEFFRPRVDPSKPNMLVDYSISMYTYCQKFKQSAHVYKEFVQVVCKVNDTEIYKDYHAFIIPKKRHPEPGYESEPEGLSILIVGVDSLSRANFYRQMPKTKELLHGLDAIEFFGYNKVQDNTFPNLVPLLSGYSVKEIQKICWFKDDDFFDKCPFMWKRYSARNYYTVFAEDAVHLGLFNYLKNGFSEQPTDYYARPFMDANEKFIGHMKVLNTQYCVGARLTVDVLMDYAYKVSVNMSSSGKKFWGFFWESSLTHDYLNVPADNDNIYYEFFRKLEMENVLSKTLVVFMSDHGMRWGSIRETYQGRMEEHLPFLYLLIPDWFKKKYGGAMRNMKRNTHLLTTHFDLHELLMDMLETEKLEDDALEERTAKTRSDRGISLFLPIPLNRTCASAGIEKTWCTCQSTKEISPSGKLVKKAVKTAINYLNTLMAEYRQCARLKLKKTLTALLEDEDEMMTEKPKDKWSDYVITFETEPGAAKFEATVRHRSGSNTLAVLGDISRINIYGNQSYCVSNYRLKRYCFCL